MTSLLLLASALLFGAEMIIDVPEGTVVSNTTGLTAETEGDVLIKTGKGTWYKTDTLGAPLNFSKFEIREGTVQMACGTSLFRPPLIVIRDGATLLQLGSASYKGRDVTIQIDKGGTFNDYGDTSGRASPKLTDITGEGTYVNYRRDTAYDAYKAWTAATLPNFTGDLVFGQKRDDAVWFGDGADAANDPDLGKYGSFTMAGGTGVNGRYPEVRFQNVAPIVVTNRFGGLGQLAVQAGSSVTFSNLWLKQGAQSAFSLYGTVTSVNNRVSFPHNSSYFHMNHVDARYVQIGGVACGPWPFTAGSMRYTKVYHKRSSQCAAGGDHVYYGTRILENGAEFWTEFQQPYRTYVNSGSTLVFLEGGIQASCGSEEKPIVLSFDNGTMRLDQNAGLTFGISAPKQVRFEIGAGGMTVEAVSQGDRYPNAAFTDGCAITDNGSNGPLTLRGTCTYQFYAPLDIGGTVTMEYGEVTANNKASFYAEGAYPFGRGDLVIDQSRLNSGLPSGTTLRLANGEGAKLRLRGAAAFQPGSGAIEIGPTNATACSVERPAGTAITFEKGLGGGVKFNGGLPLGTNGKLPVIPLIVRLPNQSTYSGDGWGGEIGFLTVDAAGNVSRFTDYVTTLGNDPTEVFWLTADTTIKEDKAAAALDVGKGKTLTIKSGAKVTVGDGTGTAVVLMNNGNIKGDGTLDFGTAEGVITANVRGGTINSVIAGSGGVSVVASTGSDNNACGVRFGGANTYTGGTRISSYYVRADNNLSFGTGDVWALGGQGLGGVIIVDSKTKITLANNLHLSGRGMKRGGVLGGNAENNYRMGAFWAYSTAELTGSVELVGPTRVVAENQATELRFSGVISGDALEFYNLKQSLDAAGTVVFTQPNTYTGLTELVRTTLVLEPGATTGTGEVELDGGLLVVKTDRSGKTFANRLRGVGTVKLDGPRNALVNFATHPTEEEDPFYQAENVLDVNGRARAINSLAGFASITNTGAQAVHLSVLGDAEGSFAGAVDPTVSLHYGKIYMRGLAVVVR